MDKLLAILGGNIGDVFSKIVGTFKLSPETAAQLEKAKEDHAADLALMQLQMQGKLQDALTAEVQAASSNIQAEEKSGDKYTSRARPTFLYICNLVILWNYVIVPLWHEKPIDLPEPLFWLFGSVMLGYVGARSWEKISGVQGADDEGK